MFQGNARAGSTVARIFGTPKYPAFRWAMLCWCSERGTAPVTFGDAAMANAGDGEKKIDVPKEPDDPVKNIIGNAFGGLLAAILAGLSLITFHYADTLGWAFAGLIWLTEIILIAALTATFLRDFGRLGAGADPIGSRRRESCDALLDDLKQGGRPNILYSR
jgi:hypothetical protein